MKMSFHIGENEIILFDEWHAANWEGIGWSMVGIVLLTSIYEGLKSYRDHLYVNVTRLHKNTGSSCKRSLFSRIHVFQAILHALQLAIGYCLMLIFMTYNTLLCLAVVIGGALGYWLFSWEKSSGDNIDCCL